MNIKVAEYFGTIMVKSVNEYLQEDTFAEL